MRKIIGYLFISALLGILSLIYYTFYWCMYIPLLPVQPSVKYILIIGHFLFAMLIWSLISVILSEPGKVPPYWGFYQSDNESRQKRYCMLCHVFKPDRCHHCSVCNRCVLNMDHHCPWINNCVGFFNRKSFILLLIYSLSNLYFIFLFMTPLIWDIAVYLYVINTQNLKAAVSFFPHFHYIGVYLLVVFLTFVLTNFTKFHISLVLNNSTTIESFDKNSSGITFNVGKSKNWKQVFGKNPWLWFCPIYGATGKPDGDGVIWPQTFVVSENREGFENENEQDNKKVLKLDQSKEEKSKLTDSDTSFLSHNKKSIQVDLRE